MSCAKCFIKPDECPTDDGKTKICPGYVDQEYDENCNPIGDRNSNPISSPDTSNIPNYANTGSTDSTDTTPKASTVTIDKDTNTSGTYGPKKENEEVYINGILVVNKTYSIPSTYGPASAKGTLGECTYEDCFTNQTWKAWNSMKDAATFAGIHLKIGSGYRSYQYQNQIYMNYVARDGQAVADTYSARPGHSEHQTGLAMDICSTDANVSCIDSGFDNSAEAKWLSENCYKYGFIIRYPQGKEDKTGYKYESWHVRYVGTELAKTLYNNGNWVSIEEYFDITSQY
jgi:D-alanyl-D-alanine carboxypeptidase